MFERAFLVFIGIILILTSLLCLYGWKAHDYSLITLYSHSYPIQFNTALLIGLIGIATIAGVYKKKYICYLLVSLIVAHSIVILLQFILKKNYGIDDLFNTPFFIQLHNSTGRMSPNTAITFFMSALTLFLIPNIEKNRWFPIISGALGFTIFSFAFLPVIGFFGEIDAAYGWSLIIRMSLITSICFCVYGISIAIYSWIINRSMNGADMHRWFAIPYALSIFLITVFLWQAIISEQDKRRAEIERSESNFIASQLQTSIESRFLALNRMANRWQIRKGIPYNEIKSDAELYIKQQDGLNMIGFIESGKLIYEFLDVNQPKMSDALLKQILETDQNLFQTPNYIIVRLPLDKDNTLVAMLHSVDLIRQIIKDDQRHFLISIRNGNNILYQSYGFPNIAFSTQARVKYNNIIWNVSSFSTDYTHGQNKLSILSLIVGSVLSLLVGIAIFSSHSLKLRSQELQDAQKSLVEQEKLASLGSLTAGIAHEIKNPLNFINNFSDLATEQIKEYKSTHDTSLLDMIEKNMKAINAQGTRANGIITKMLAHSRQNTSEETPTNINALLDEDASLALHSFKMKHPYFSIQVKKEWDENLPLISISKEDLSRVTLNLINNAFYALEVKKGLNPTLTLKTERKANGIVIKILDNGIGIPDNIRDKLFTPFFTTKPTGMGTGLGLSLSRAFIVEELGGRIDCKSKEGEFTEFTLFIPFRTAKARLHQSDAT